jgi:hypothetical protein
MALFPDPLPAHLDWLAQETESSTRGILETWYSRFPDENGDVKARVLSRDSGNLLSATSELYLHDRWTSAGLRVEPHPLLQEGMGRPDFLVESSVIVEVVGEAGYEPAGDRLRRLWRELDRRVPHPTLVVSIEVLAPLRTEAAPSVFAAWVAAYLDEFSTAPPAKGEGRVWQGGGGALHITPRHVPSKAAPSPIVFAIHSGAAFAASPHIDVGERLKKKSASKYGIRAESYVVAFVSAAPRVGLRAVVDELFGRERATISWEGAVGGSPATTATERSGGRFRPTSEGPRNTRLSAVLFLRAPLTHEHLTPTIFLLHNPFARTPLKPDVLISDFQMTWRAEEDRFVAQWQPRDPFSR